ncbi:MAG: outer membrane beta-barrel domain-containing protein [Bdellovibrionales bacterium]|nr:outer membrane beta-barrel domain-containing protein [Bdellovibrionales bacterium]
MKVHRIALLPVSILVLMLCQNAFGADKKKKVAAPAPVAAATAPTRDAAAAAAANEKAAEEGESVDVSKITEKYWAQGKETELGVVQNRKYTSAGRFELEGFFGTISSDPMLTVHHFGGSLGYHFDQYFSLHAIAWRSIAKGSDALAAFDALNSGTNANTNLPSGFYGLQANYNILYGKASLVGKAIIYVDIFVLGGLGITGTETGNYFTPFLGLGQKIHLNKYMALSLDYRVMRYNETIKYKSPGTLPVTHSVGDVAGDRANTTDVVTLGISFFY